MQSLTVSLEALACTPRLGIFLKQKSLASYLSDPISRTGKHMLAMASSPSLQSFDRSTACRLHPYAGETHWPLAGPSSVPGATQNATITLQPTAWGVLKAHHFTSPQAHTLSSPLQPGSTLPTQAYFFLTLPPTTTPHPKLPNSRPGPAGSLSSLTWFMICFQGRYDLYPVTCTLVCSSVSLDYCAPLHHHYEQDIEQSHHPQNSCVPNSAPWHALIGLLLALPF